MQSSRITIPYSTSVLLFPGVPNCGTGMSQAGFNVVEGILPGQATHSYDLSKAPLKKVNLVWFKGPIYKNHPVSFYRTFHNNTCSVTVISKEEGPTDVPCAAAIIVIPASDTFQLVRFSNGMLFAPTSVGCTLCIPSDNDWYLCFEYGLPETPRPPLLSTPVPVQSEPTKVVPEEPPSESIKTPIVESVPSPPSKPDIKSRPTRSRKQPDRFGTWEQ